MKIATLEEGVTRREERKWKRSNPCRPWLFSSIHRINHYPGETDYVIHWILIEMIYPVHSVIHRSTNWGQLGLVFSSSFELFPPCITFLEGGDFHARSRKALVLPFLRKIGNYS